MSDPSDADPYRQPFNMAGGPEAPEPKERKQFRTREVYKLGNITVAYDEDEGYKLIVPAGMKPDLDQLFNDASWEICSCEARLTFLRSLVLDLAMRTMRSTHKKPEPPICGAKFGGADHEPAPFTCKLPKGHDGPHMEP
jgi:hypothetical protein